MKKIFLIVVAVLLFIGVEVNAQNNWSAGNHYQYRGNVWTECGLPYATTDNWGNYSGIYKTCKTSVWYQEWKEGYVYYWNSYTGRWYKEFYRGYSWYFKWNITYVFVRW